MYAPRSSENWPSSLLVDDEKGPGAHARSGEPGRAVRAPCGLTSSAVLAHRVVELVRPSEYLVHCRPCRNRQAVLPGSRSSRSLVPPVHPEPWNWALDGRRQRPFGEVPAEGLPTKLRNSFRIVGEHPDEPQAAHAFESRRTSSYLAGQFVHAPLTRRSPALRAVPSPPKGIRAPRTEPPALFVEVRVQGRRRLQLQQGVGLLPVVGHRGQHRRGAPCTEGRIGTTNGVLGRQLRFSPFAR